MIGLLQRVTQASVSVDGELIGQIGRGLLVLVAVHRDDVDADIERLADRILGYRVFPDADERMNRSLIDEDLALLLVPQFTLAADTKKGTRASFTRQQRRKRARRFSGDWWRRAKSDSLPLKQDVLVPICKLRSPTTAR